MRWLSGGKILTRLFVLREEIKLLFQQQNNVIFQELLFDDKWVAKLKYMAGVFSLLNELNISLQGQHMDVFTVRGKIDAFRRKTPLWQTRWLKEM